MDRLADSRTPLGTEFPEETKPFDPALLADAEAAVRDLARDYIQWVNADIERLDRAFARLDREPGTATGALQDIFAAAHDMKGQGSTFGYPLVTRIADSLCKYLTGTTKSPDVVGAHIDALRAVIDHRLSGDGGLAGQRIAAGLEAATAGERG